MVTYFSHATQIYFCTLDHDQKLPKMPDTTSDNSLHRFIVSKNINMSNKLF